MTMDKKWIYGIAWLVIFVMCFGVLGPAMVSSQSTLAVLTGIAVIAGAVYVLFNIGKRFFAELETKE